MFIFEFLLRFNDDLDEDEDKDDEDDDEEQCIDDTDDFELEYILSLFIV